jgi:multidrug efflux pump subunit AcrA (membrane-fusion protein)
MCFIVRPSRRGAIGPGMAIQAVLPARDARPVGRKTIPPGSGRASVQSSNYWSGTVYAPSPGNAWNFNFNNGNQNNTNQNNQLLAWAVHAG